MDNKLSVITGCSFGYAGTDSICPDEAVVEHEAPYAGWNFHVGEDDSEFHIGDRNISRAGLDPDFHLDNSDNEWMEQCLTDPNYPPRSQESPTSRKQ